MSKLKISPNLFLEVAELNRLVKFLKDDGYEQIFKSMLKSYGIVNDENNSFFKVSLKDSNSNVITINPGIAFDSKLRAIRLNETLELSVENTESVRWIVLQYDYTNYEEGTINITSDGTIQGIGTSFLEVLRGQPNFPTKVKFNSLLNKEEYEVVSVSNDTSAIISGSLVPENNVKYSVIGAFTPGFDASDYNKTIYEIDSYKISLIDSPDVPELTEDQYILASLEFSDNGIIITDRRAGYMFNNSNYSKGFLPESNEIVSLLSVKKVQDNLIELKIEHGYSVSDFEVVNIQNSNVFKIKSGKCNFLGDGNIPNGLFKNWVLINKNTMKKVTVIDNVNKDLYITLDEDILSGDTSDFMIVPPYPFLEYEISVLNSPIYNVVTQGSRTNRVLIPVPYGVVIIDFRYRMFDEEKSTPWQKFSIAEYTNESGEKIMIGDSKITVVNTTIVKQRNYS